MAGTKIGGVKAAQKNLANDPDFYKRIGARGGANGHTGGFAANPELARLAGAKGGRASKRRKASLHTLHTTSTDEAVARLSAAQPVYKNLSGDKESGSIISAAGESSVKRPSVWSRVFGGAGSANR